MSPEDKHSTEGGRSRSQSISFTRDHMQPADIKAAKTSILSLLSRSPVTPAAPTTMASSPSSSISSDSELRTPPLGSPTLGKAPKIAGEDHLEDTLDEMSDLNAWKRNAAYSLGRRSTWTGETATSPISSWLKGLPSPTSPPVVVDNDTSSSLGLFRRLSFGGSGPVRRPIWKQAANAGPAAVPEQAVDDANDRLGRNIERKPATKRRLSPMASKMLTGQFY